MLTRPLLIILSTLLIGCVHHTSSKMPGQLAPTTNKIQQTRPVSSFNQVIVDGRINIDLHTGYSKHQVILRGDPRDLSKVIMRVQNNALHIGFSGEHPKFGEVSAIIDSRYLTALTYRGFGRITGKQINSSALSLMITNPGTTKLGGNIHLRRLEVKGPGYVEISGVTSQHLELSMKGNPKVQLSGIIGLSSIDLVGDGWLGLHWIKSEFLTIRAKGKSFLQLAGAVNKLDLELWDRAQFHGRYLRVRRLFAKTHDHSIAEINAVGHQHTLATDASDIAFYNLPVLRSDFMAYNGAVLDMRGNSDQAYTRYNKYYASNS